MTTFQIVQYPVQPGICRVCGVPYGIRPLIDTSLTGDFCNRMHWNPVSETVDDEVDVNQAGAVYICESCVINMGELVGMLDYVKAEKLKRENEALKEQYAELSAKNLGLEKIVDGYRDLGALSISAGAIDHSVSVSILSDPTPEESESPESDSDSDGIAAEVTSGANSGKSEVSESADLEESSGVSDVDVSESGESRDKSDHKSSPAADVLGF